MSDQHAWDAAEAAVENARMRREQADERATRGENKHSLRLTGRWLLCDCGWTCWLPESATVPDAVGLFRGHIAGTLF